ncbi:MAG: Cys-Gln thioester bond-forming surface protein [Clostridiales Family XIII bacterium]|jgi:uncharacterized surface anchored protein|nr:Cys-Gln thioester bond-forming surface protein [Clostridiales Family XIII bacterium]
MKKRMLSIILIVALLVPLFSQNVFADYATGDTLEGALAHLNIAYREGDLNWLTLKGTVRTQWYTYFRFDNRRTGHIEEHPVYCIDPNLYGVPKSGILPDGTETLEYYVSDKVGDARYAAILSMGYPHQSLASLGLSTQEEAYYATKMALWAYILGCGPADFGINPAYSGSAAAQRVYNVALRIFTESAPAAAGGIVEPAITLTPDSPVPYLDPTGQCYQQIVTIHSTAWIGDTPGTLGNFELEWANQSEVPVGTKIYAADGTDITGVMEIQAENSGQGFNAQIKIMYPASSVDGAGLTAGPELTATGLLAGNNIFTAYYISDVPGNQSYQRYLVEADPKQEIRASLLSQFSPDTRNEMGIKIKKVEKGTGIPLEGAIFEILDPDGVRIYSLPTDASGIIDLPLARAGSYTVTEKTPPRWHLPASVQTQNVTVRYNEVAEVTFENDAYGSLRVRKVDAANGNPLAGATIQIKHIASNLTRTATSDGSGFALFDLLPVGAYEITEFTAPQGYAPDTAARTVNVLPLNESETSYTLTNSAKPGLRIVKIDKATMKPLENVSFEIYKGAALYGTYTTDMNGEIALAGLDPDTYTAKETAVPAGYVLDPTTQRITLTAGGGIARLIFFNDATPGIWLIKADSETLKPLPNAVFLIKRVGGGYAKEFTTGLDGKIELTGSENLEPGAYTVEEIGVPEGYLIDGAVRTIQINAGENARFVFTNTKKPGIEIIKHDTQNNRRLGGAAFRIAKIEDGSHYFDRITDTQGRIAIDGLDPGVYGVTEISAPEGYVPNNAEFHVELFPGKTSTLVVNNEKKPDLRIVKRDEKTGALLAGASFTVRKADSATLANVTTDAKGEAWLYGLDPGVYELIETLPPSGYLPNGEPQLITLFPNRTGAAQFANGKKPGLTILKVDEMTSLPLAGAEFSVKHKDGSIVYEGLTDANGLIHLGDLKADWYTITEIAAPYGYLLAEKPKDVKFEAGTVTQVKFDNRPRPSLRIVKRDADTGVPLAGAVFHVRKTAAGDVSEFVTGADGTVTAANLDEGVYSVTEIQAPAGYELDENPHRDVRLEWGRIREAVFTNKAKPGLTVKKIDADTGEPLAGASFRVALAGGFDFTDVQTDASGSAFLESLAPGVYEVSEISAPEGYLADAPPVSVTLEAGTHTEVIMPDHAKPGLTILKADEATGLPLAGAEFSIGRKGGGIVHEGLTDKNGRIVTENLDDGWYTITEIAAPEGYLIANAPKDVLLEGGKRVTVKFDNRLRPALKIVKLDERTKTPLAGAKFRVTKTENNTAGEYVTDAGGEITVYNLDESIYTIEEISAPNGYILDARSKDIKLEWGKVKQLVFTNREKPALVILKKDEVTGLPLAGAGFSVGHKDGSVVWEGVTGENGEISLADLDPDWYTIEETAPPQGYLTRPAPKDVMFEADRITRVSFGNIKKPTLVFTKTGAVTGKPLPGAMFKIEYENADGGMFPVGTFKTDSNGQIVLPDVNPGRYVVTETLPAPGYALPKNPITRIYLSPGENAYGSTVSADGIDADAFSGIAASENDGETDVSSAPADGGSASAGAASAAGSDDFALRGNEEAVNYPLNSIVLKKISAITGELLPGAVFELRRVTEEITGTSGTVVGRYTTGHDGTVVITGLEPGGYIAEETRAPANYTLSENSEQQTWLKPDGTSIEELTFSNYPYGSLLIAKTDAKTGLPLANAKFKVTDANGAAAGNSNGEFATGTSGEILIPNLKPGAYVITETAAPEGYAPTAAPKTVTVGTDGKTYTASFENEPTGGLVIRKLDRVTKEPLPGAEFSVTAADGSVVGTSGGVFATDESGTIQIPALPKGSYVVRETKAPDGYVLENKTQTIAVDYGKTYTLDMYNGRMSGLQIVKIDASTKAPLKDAKFTVYRMDGGVVGSYETNGDGVIILDKLAPGWYKAAETKAPDGWLTDDTPRDFEITSNQFVKLVFENKRLSSLQIRKVSDPDGAPLAGAVFEVRKQNGEYAGEYTTGRDGAASVPDADPGWYVISETKAPEGYILGGPAKTVEVKPAAPTVVTFANKPMAGLQIVKLDAETRLPVRGAEFEIAKMNGERIGTYRTDANGMIFVPALIGGWYTAVEKSAPKGYVTEDAVRSFEIRDGETTRLEITNRKASSLMIRKTDSVSGKGIYGVTFILYDANKNPILQLVTDQSGYAYPDADLPDGRYYIRELEPAEGYEPDDELKTVYVEYGKTSLIEWKNKPITAQIQVVKYSSDYNPVTGAPAGSLLAGAVFEVTRAKSGAVVCHITSDARGVAATEPLPLGRYFITEVTAPPFYQISGERHEAELEYPGQIIRISAYNKSAELGTTIKKTGNIEVMAGDGMRYDFSLANTSNVPLSDFYLSDRLPTDAARAATLVTGTYSQRLYYRALYKTNYGDYRVLAQNLLSTNNYSFDLTERTLGLMQGETVTDVKLEFGTAPVGFASIAKPMLFVTTLPNLPNGYQIVNRCEVGGIYQGAPQTSTAAWLTKIVRFGPGLPKTGY